ncbi:LIM domain-containing protein PLIM2b [Linum grandiflorum]
MEFCTARLISSSSSRNREISARISKMVIIDKRQSRTPSKLSSMFSGTLDKCSTCGKTVYPLEKVTMESECYHKTCFRCAIGGCHLTHSSYAALDGVLYCKHHFAQLFMEKGNYNHILEAASHKRSASTPPPEAVEGEAEEAKPADDDADDK